MTSFPARRSSKVGGEGEARLSPQIYKPKYHGGIMARYNAIW